MLRWRVRRAQKRHRRMCQTCRAASDIDEFCDEAREAILTSFMLRIKRKDFRQNSNLNVHPAIRADYRRDVQRARAEIAADEKLLWRFIDQNR